MNTAKPELIIYKENKPKVLSRLKDGRIDYVDFSSWSFVDRFFAFLISSKFFEWASSTYPTPRRRHEVPIWFILSCLVQQKLFCKSQFRAIPGILKSGSILSRVKFNIGLKLGGFNHKNKKPRESPVDFDTLRKFFKDTNSEQLISWFNNSVVGWFRRHRAFDKEGIFLLDSSKLAVPDNPNYENIARLPIGDEGNFIEVHKLTDEGKANLKYKPCYDLTTLLHISPEADYFLYAGASLGPGTNSPLKEAEKIVDNFLQTKGKGIIKWLICDRAFIDGPLITKWKTQSRIDILIPLRKNMAALTDAIGLAKLSKASWQVYKAQIDKEGNRIKTEEIIGLTDVTSWEDCQLPLYVALMKTTDKDGNVDIWGLASTYSFKDPKDAFDLYKKRSQIEERHRQLKNCWLIKKFSSTSFNLVTSHVIFVLMTYSLIQLYLKRKDLNTLANKTIDTLRQQERMGKDNAIVYAQNCFAIFDFDEVLNIVIDMRGPPRDRLSRWLKKFGKNKVRTV